MAISHVYADNGDTSIDRKPGVSTVHVDNMPEGQSGGVTSVNGQTGDVTLTASDVNALPSSTVIPSKTSDLQNDSGFITASDVPAQVQSDWNEADNTDPAYIKNKPTLFSGNYNDLTNKPDLSIYAESNDLASVATSGSYNDLSNTPSIPAAQVNSDWNASSGVAEILNKPTIPSGEDLVPAHSSSDSGKVLGVNSSGNTEWVNAGGGGGSYTAGNAIDITSDAISVKYDGQTITQDLVPSTPIDVSTVTSAGDARIEIPSDILAMIKSSSSSEFAITIPANTFKQYGTSTAGTYSLTVNLCSSSYSSWDKQYQGNVTVTMTTAPYLDAQTIKLKCGSGYWGSTYYYNTGYLQLVINGYNAQADSTTLTTPVQFAQMVSGNGPLKVNNPLPSDGVDGQYLKRTTTGPVWANLPAQVNANWNATTGAGVILNKPTIPNNGNGTIDVSGTVISVKYDTETLKQIDGSDVDFSGVIPSTNNGIVELDNVWRNRFYNGSGQGVAQIPGMTYSIYNVVADTKAYLAIFDSTSGVYGTYMYYSSKPLSYSNVNGSYYIDAQDVIFDFSAESANGWAGNTSRMNPYLIGIIFTHNNGSSFNMPASSSAGTLFKLGLYAQGAGPLSVKIPIPAFDTTTDLGKVLQVTANGLAWVSLS